MRKYAEGVNTILLVSKLASCSKSMVGNGLQPHQYFLIHPTGIAGDTPNHDTDHDLQKIIKCEVSLLSLSQTGIHLLGSH